MSGKKKSNRTRVSECLLRAQAQIESGKDNFEELASTKGGDELFCHTCGETVQCQWTTVKRHCESHKHKEKLKILRGDGVFKPVCKKRKKHKNGANGENSDESEEDISCVLRRQRSLDEWQRRFHVRQLMPRAFILSSYMYCMSLHAMMLFRRTFLTRFRITQDGYLAQTQQGTHIRSQCLMYVNMRIFVQYCIFLTLFVV